VKHLQQKLEKVENVAAQQMREGKKDASFSSETNTIDRTEAVGQ
jgi:hypothetical protein